MIGAVLDTTNITPPKYLDTDAHMRSNACEPPSVKPKFDLIASNGLGEWQMTSRVDPPDQGQRGDLRARHEWRELGRCLPGAHPLAVRDVEATAGDNQGARYGPAVRQVAENKVTE